MKIPVLLFRNSAITHSQIVAGIQLVDPLEKCFVSRQIIICEKPINREGVNPSFDGRIDQQGFDFRGEHKRLASINVVEWLNTDAVSRQEKQLFALVPKSKGEHPSKPFHTISPHLFIEMNDHLRICVGFKGMTTSFKLGSELGEIINLTVVDHPYRTVFVTHWLGATLQANDGETSVTQPHRAGEILSLSVRSAMDNLVHHLSEERPMNRLVSV